MAKARASTKKANAATESGGIEIIGEGRYPLVPLSSITVVERPAEGEETSKLFFNPRSVSSFTPERMRQLQTAIRTDGLQQPPIVRATVSGGKITLVELIAGERRVRSLLGIQTNDMPCYDDDAIPPEKYKAGDSVISCGRFGIVNKHVGDLVHIDFEADSIGCKETKICQYVDVYPTVSGAKLYENVPCKVVYNCTDRKALRLAWTENNESEPLTISEEIALVERLERMGHKQEEIAEMLNSNVTWVSQTSNFRSQLPEEAFQKLLSGKLSRNTAVTFLSFAGDDRDTLYDGTVKVEQRESAEKIQTHTRQKEELEDEEDLNLSEAKEADKAGDDKAAAKLRRKAATAKKKAEKEAERLERAKKDSGVLKQGHVKQAATELGIQPKKAKVLDRDEIESVFVKGIMPYLDGEVDKVTGNKIPMMMAALVRRTARAIIDGCHDPLFPIREYMYDNDEWQRPADEGSGIDNEATDFDVDTSEEELEIPVE